MEVMNQKRPTATEGTMNHAKTSFSTEIFAGAIISVVQYLAHAVARQGKFISLLWPHLLAMPVK
jgi:hypothetical protein